MPSLSQKIQKYKNTKIAIYGLSTETKKVLDEFGDAFSIVGLLDGYKSSGTLYGRPIISIEDAIKCRVKLILVVARPGSCRAIAKRIKKICVDNRIDLFDIRGRDLCDMQNPVYDLKGVEGIKKADLLRTIDEHEVVSIDLFDTLIMRRVMFPSDVSEVAGCRLRERGIIIEDFPGKRLEAEKYLSKTTAPTLSDIYGYMIETYSITGITVDELRELEWKVDQDLIVPRRDMCALIADIFYEGKEIYIVSDTFYTKRELEEMLGKWGITFYTDIFASCEYGTSKSQGLFQELKNKISGKTCLHIGDDIFADVECAEKYGIPACQIYGGLELLEKLGYLGLWDDITDLSSKIKVGMFVSKLFNSPFQFETEERKIEVKTAYEIGYLFFAPIIRDFLIWFDWQVKEHGLRNIWFCARDGYLLKNIYDQWKGDTSSVYFLTSRTAAIRAGVETKEDLKNIEQMKFSGTLREHLEKRFGLAVGTKGEDIISGSLMDFSEEIFEKASADRENYKTYIRQLHMEEGGIAFFDFVAKGTSQQYIERLVENHLKGIYFLRLGGKDMDGKTDIISFYEDQGIEDNVIFDDYYILETVLTSFMPSVTGFDEQGMACYEEETRDGKSLACIRSVQDGISDYFMEYLRICPYIDERIDKRLDESFLKLIHKVFISAEDFLDLTVEDPFFNRTTCVTDLL